MQPPAAPPLKLLAGLGNPGSAYALSRHNIGFMAADCIARRAGIAVAHAGFQALMGRGSWCGHEVILAEPQTYMNRSGQSIRAVADGHAIAAENIIVMHDDMDLAFGSLKIKIRGGSAGHRGVESVIDHLQTDSFLRLRIGIGRPADAAPGTEYVLEQFSPDELARVDAVTGTVFQCIEAILRHGVAWAMNRFHAPAPE